MTVYPMPFYASQWLPMLALLAILTMVAGNLLALTQNNMKRMMAYSSIAQAGYMLVGVAAWSTASASGVGALASVLVYLLAYAFTNLGAFAVIIAVEDDTGSSDISAYRGLMRRAPFLAVAMAVFFLGLVGIPPLAGFIGKFAVFSAAIGAGQAGLALVGVVMGVVSVGYYFRVFRAMFFDQPSEGETTTSVAPAVRGVIVAALVMTLLIGLYSGPFIDFAARAAAAVEPYAAVLTAAQ
jgi:NADH:ubiquinone oxidoreductase subunit 2 (subunit N)